MHLTDKSIQAKKVPGRYTDDETKGLHIWVKANGRKYWNLRYTSAGNRKGIGLGAYPDVSLKQARILATEQRNLINKGVDPIQVKNPKNATVQAPAREKFQNFALDYIKRINI